MIYECFKPKTHKEVKTYIKNILSSHLDTYCDESLYAKSNQNEFLQFDSNFECGNLQRVFAKSKMEYELYVNSDTNTRNRCQWFYFSVSNTKINTIIKFNIMNLTKYPSFTKIGMKPLVFSSIDKVWNETIDVEVYKTVSNFYEDRTIAINNDQANLDDCSNPEENYVLSFKYKFSQDKDKVFFAFLEPYSYTRLETFIKPTVNLILIEDNGKLLNDSKETIEII